jgi:nitrogen fixation protein FixH
MKTLAVVVASAFNLIVFGNAYAHGDHPSEHGGVVGRGDDAIVVEFVMEKGTLNVYVQDEAGNPLATKNVTGTLTVSSPQRPAQEVKLVSAGSDKFAAPGITPVPGDRLRARIKLPSGEEFESVALFLPH